MLPTPASPRSLSDKVGNGELYVHGTAPEDCCHWVLLCERGTADYCSEWHCLVAEVSWFYSRERECGGSDDDERTICE